ncbi:hypothetical protein OWR29_47850 [Actinoplanes sp. Pm04-4]|uniref:Uncharacterized protein n=1 Tax=Paractinoplanes pyxinae TaxID=2997416 RepID=A0ABT4BGU8_9ACTN|nr:hypothetical protein [Actinoplanes pyxinae]MCY1145761.1 hypothetical protein [Actinoplanes pyxinae]
MSVFVRLADFEPAALACGDVMALKQRSNPGTTQEIQLAEVKRDTAGIATRQQHYNLIPHLIAVVEVDLARHRDDRRGGGSVSKPNHQRRLTADGA